MLESASLLTLLLLFEQPLDLVNNLASRAEDVAEAEAIAFDSDRPDEEVDQRPIGDDKRKEDTKVSPLVIRVHIQCSHVLGAGGVWTVLAVSRGSWIQ